jgi:hypothetical protein
VTADVSQLAVAARRFEIWVVGTGTPSPRAARITIFAHVFDGTVSSKWRSLNVSHDRWVVVVVVVVVGLYERHFKNVAQ